MLTQEELLYLEQGLYKAIANDVDTKKPDNLRGRVNAHFIGQYEATGGKSYEARIGGEVVGTVSVTPSKKSEKTEVVVDNSSLALKWAMDNGFVTIDTEAVNRHFDETGEVGDGFRIDRWTHETKPRVTLRIDPAKVMEHAGKELLSIAGLLMGGDDGR